MRLLLVLFLSTLFLEGCATRPAPLLDIESMSFLKGFHEENNGNNEKEGRVSTTTFIKENRQFDVTLVKNVDRVAGERYLIEEPALFESVFDPKPAPYFSVPNNKTNCPIDIRPQHGKGNNESAVKKYFKTFANSRKVFGLCESSPMYYVYYKVFMYCPSTAAFLNIDYYILEKNFDQSDNAFIEGLSCK
ncbi:hypothetical protein D3C87_1361440 [compost metagenome]